MTKSQKTPPEAPNSVSTSVDVEKTVQPKRAGDGPRKRATALPPEERRQNILTATIELMTENGLQVTTKQIAAAAGIAEGTLFTVFKSKDECVHAAVLAVMCSETLLQQLAELDSALELRPLLYEIADLLDADVSAKHAFMSACRLHPAFFADAEGTREKMHGWHEQRSQIILQLLKPHSAQLQVPAQQLLYILDAAIFSVSATRNDSKGKCQHAAGLTPRSAVDLLLDGALNK